METVIEVFTWFRVCVILCYEFTLFLIAIEHIAEVHAFSRPQVLEHASFQGLENQ